MKFALQVAAILHWLQRRNNFLKITRLHIGITLLIALLLHGGLAMWLVLSAKDPLPESVKQIVRINLQAVVAEATVITPEPVVEPPPEPVQEPKVEPKPTPEPPPKPKSPPKPVIQELPAEPIAPPTPEPVKTPEVVREVIPSPVETRVVPPLDAEATAKYEQLLQAWLEKHKKYPKRAKRMRIEGEGTLRVLIDRAGKAQQISLEQSTGNRLLDKAALEMAERADPFPAMPENDPRQSLEFFAPVAFLLR